MIKLTFLRLILIASVLVFNLSAKAQKDSLIKIAPGLFEITGLGGNVTVKETSQGIIIVDAGTSFAAGKRIQEIVAGISKKQITHLIITHYHYDHTGGMDAFPAGALIVAHKNVAQGIRKDETQNKKDIEETIPQKIKLLKNELNGLSPENKTLRTRIDSSIKAETQKLENLKKRKFVYPEKEFDSEMSIIAGKDTINLHYQGNAHTNGDTWVHFKNENIVATGDLLFTNSFPFIDFEIGANTENWAKIVNQLADKKFKTYISGHSTLAYSEDLKRFASYLTDLRKAVSAELSKGKSLEEAAKTIDIEAYRDFGYRFFKEQNIEAVYKELGKK
jgi:glyoxylase-like metal-dependent hydrolase (beta-lactamase superfamily II)